MDQERIHQEMLKPSFYPERTSSVLYRETHISRVYLTDRHVYKIKKPVNMGFLDFSSLEQRHFFCEEEVRLNSRFCLDTYLGVEPVCIGKEGLHIGQPGDVVEYLVKMRRLPENLMLNRKLEEQAADLPLAVIQIARQLADLHTALPKSNHDEGYSDLMHVRRNWDENFHQTAAFEGSSISPEGYNALQSYVKGFLEDNEELIDQRESEGWVRECHGDLHAEHICLTATVRIYDCIEFNRRFRVSDILADIAFLLMDIDRHSRADLANALWHAYQSGMGLLVPERLLCFYKVYRACVRGKVEAMASADENAGAALRREAGKRALGYFNLALGYLMPPSLLITCGLMGTGKSRLAAALAMPLRADLVRSDVLRLAFKHKPDEGISSGYLQGPYSTEYTGNVYRLLEEKACAGLKAGHTVIVDASFADAARRRSMQDLAAECKVPFGVLFCQCPREVALARLYERMKEGTDESDGRVELYDIQKEHFQLPTSDETVINIDTSGPVDYAANVVLGRLPGITG
jgi:uncharacterized protein